MNDSPTSAYDNHHLYKITQCQGCPGPLDVYLEQYEKGLVEVTWTLCPFHAEEGPSYYDRTEDY